MRSRGNLTGIFLAKRNGELISEKSVKEIDSKALVSMCASVLESATEMSETMGKQQVNKIIAELNENTIYITKVDKNLFLICILNAKTNTKVIVEDLEDYLSRLKSFNL
jgi:predicted regulator of Ras-like GTPase activity (Roadblock/LC7/MglB family)